MTSSALPDNWQELLAGYVLEDLEPEELALVQRLLASHPELEDEVRSLQGTFDGLPYALAPQAPPAGLRDQILLAAQAPAQPSFKPVDAPTRFERPQRRGWHLSTWLGLGWAVTAMALGALALDNYRLRQEQQQLEAVVASFTQPQTRLYALTGAEAQPQALARLVIDPAQQSAAIVTDNLPALPADQAYRLWAVAGSQPVYCGQFNPTGESDAPIRWALPDAACDSATAQMLITAESANDPPIPAGPLVLQSQS